MGGFSEGFALGDRVMSKALSRGDNIRNRKKQDQLEVERQEDRAADQKSQKLRDMNEELRYESYRREANRSVDEGNRQQTKTRLAMQMAFMNGGLEGVDHNVLYQMMPDTYLSILNSQDQDLIDPEGDGRRVVGIPQLNAKEFGFEVAGGPVEGVKPVTKNRGTAADGDNTVQTMPVEDLAAAHFGQFDAFARKFPKDAEDLQDPESIKAFVKQLERMYYAVDGELPPAAKADAGALADKKHKNAMALQGSKDKSAMALQKQKHSDAVALKETPTASKDLSKNDRVKMIKDLSLQMKKEAQGRIDTGDMDPEDMLSNEEIVDEATAMVNQMTGKPEATGSGESPTEAFVQPQGYTGGFEPEPPPPPAPAPALEAAPATDEGLVSAEREAELLSKYLN